MKRSLVEATVQASRQAIPVLHRYARAMVWLAFIVALIGLPSMLYPFELVLAGQILTFGILALSLDLLWGKAGQLSFGQAVFFGLGAYTFGIIGKALGESNEIALIGAVAVPTAIALFIGYFLFFGRVRGAYFAIVTLALSLVGSQLAISWVEVTGGDAGLIGIPQLELGIGRYSVEFFTPESLYYLALGAALLSFGVTSLVARSNFGLVLTAIRENESRVAFCGYNTAVYLLAAMALSSAMAGLAGGIFAAASTFAAPDLLGPLLSTETLVWVAVGGRGTLTGAFVGVAVIRLLNSLVTPVLPKSWPFVVGGFFVLSVLLLPRGIVHLIRQLAEWLKGRLPNRASRDGLVEGVRPPVSGRVEGRSWGSSVGRQPSEGDHLRLEDIGVRFGGLIALHDVALSFKDRSVCSIIGPNGAGKTTLFNVISGAVRPEAGTVRFEGRDITSLRIERIARLGIVRKFQIPSVFEGLSVRQNLLVGARRQDAEHRGGSIEDRLAEILDLLGLTGREAEQVAFLSHGEKQWLEIGMALMQDSRVVLLDEPTAGMGVEETRRTAQLIQTVAADRCVLVIEHDMQFVKDLASDVVVLHEGSVLRRGTMAEIEKDHVVRDVYLGRSGSA
jgi:branched-chain amino acid transport system permease protein